MARQPASSFRITKTRSGATRVRATGSAAQALFDAMCKAHGLDNPVKPEPTQDEPKPEPQQPA
jgi:hypothetical protein